MTVGVICNCAASQQISSGKELFYILYHEKLCMQDSEILKQFI